MLRWGDKVYPISIPYGAIKRNAKRRFGGRRGISIPYGAIKREIQMNLEAEKKNFNSLWCD